MLGRYVHELEYRFSHVWVWVLFLPMQGPYGPTPKSNLLGMPPATTTTDTTSVRIKPRSHSLKKDCYFDSQN